MTLLVVTPPTSEPVTLDEARAQCRVIARDEDALLAGYVMRAREHVETYVGRTLMTTTYDLLLDGWAQFTRDGYERNGIVLPRPPLQSITTITYVDPLGATQTLAANQYRALAASDMQGDGIVIPAYGVTWPSLRDDLDVVKVRYVAGYADASTVPHAIKQAILMLTEHYFTHRGPMLTGTIATELPFTVKDLLFPWRVLC
jgi:uncharacterized phiE125 gp8 family phage protein